MKKKFQDWLRKQVGCPKCDARASCITWPTTTTTTTGANVPWPLVSNGQSLKFTYRTRGEF